MKRYGRMSSHLFALSLAICALVCLTAGDLFAQGREFNGLGMDMASLPRLSSAKTRSISPENFTGEKGKAGMATEGTGKNAARDLGQGWKVSPSVRIAAKSTFTMGTIDGSGAIQQIWMTPAPLTKTQLYILRFYWDGETTPSVEVPMSHFFACGWGKYAQINSLAVCVNPGSAFNCYWPMPFRKSAKITMENLDDEPMTLYYQINYTLTDVPESMALLPLPVPPRVAAQDQGPLHHPRRRPGPGPVRRHLPRLGSPQSRLVGRRRDQVLHRWRQGVPDDRRHGHRGLLLRLVQLRGQSPEAKKKYQTFSTPYTGLAQVLPPDEIYKVGQRFGLYRWHITDPVRFDKDLRVTIQALGWQEGGRYLQEEDDIAAVSYWYQTEPHAAFPKLPGVEALKVGPQQVQK